MSLADLKEQSESGMPALFTEEQLSALSDCRKCRHVFRNSYAHELVWDTLKPLMERSPCVLKWFEDSLNRALREKLMGSGNALP